MANYYWVGGTGTWDAATTTNWASSSGGAGGAGVPTSADNAYFDGSSDTGAPFTVTISTGAVCADIIIGDGSTVTALDQTMTLAGSAAWSIYGSLYFPATNLTRTYTGAITFAATTIGKTITTNGVSLGGSVAYCNGVGGEWTLGGAVTFSQLHIISGSFVTANYNVTAVRLRLDYTTTRALTLGSSTVSLSDSGTSVLSVTNTNLTLNAGTSTMQFTTASPQPNFGIGTTWYNITYTITGVAGTPQLNGTFTCNNFTRSINHDVRVSLGGGTVTITGDLAAGTGFEGTGTIICNGVARFERPELAYMYPTGNFNVLSINNGTAAGTVKSVLFGGNQTITGALHVLSGFGATFNITATAGAITAATVNTGGERYNVGDVLTVSGGGGDARLTVATLSGTAVATVTISTPGTGYTTATGVATTLYSSALNPSRRVFIRSDSTGTARTITAANVNVTNADFRDITAAGAGSWSDSSRIRFWGDCKGNTGITFSAATNAYRRSTGNWSDTQWSNSSGGVAATQWFPLVQDTAIFDTGTSTGTHTVNANYQIGAFDASALNVAATLATGTTTPTFYGNVTLDADLTLSGTGALTFSGRNTQTITSAGKTFTQPLTVDSLSGTAVMADALTTSSTFTLTQGTLTFTDLVLTCSTFLVSGNFLGRTMNFGTTGKVVVTGAAGSGNTLLTGFQSNLVDYLTLMNGSALFELTNSGSATRNVDNAATIAPGAAYTPNIKVTAGTGVVTLPSVGSANQYYRSFDFTGFTGTLNPADVSGCHVYNDIVLDPGMTVNPTTNPTSPIVIIGTSNITTNGVVVNCSFSVGSTALISGNVTLQDNFTHPAGKSFTLVQGTLDLDGNTLSVDTFSSSNSNTRVIDFGTNGVLEVRGTGTAFNAATGTNLTTAGTGSISFVSGYTKTFAGGGRTYPTLSHNGAGILSITGANTFANINNAYDGLYNLLTYTEQFTNAAWSNAPNTTANATTAPDGTLTADSFNSTASTGGQYTYESITLSAGNQFTASVYIKNNGANYITFSCTNDSNAWVSITADLTASPPVISKTGAGSSGTYTSSSIADVGNGWYRISMTGSASANLLYFLIQIATSANPTYTSSKGYQADYNAGLGQNIYLWGAQLVQGTAALDYQRVATPNDWATIAQVGSTTLTFPSSTTTTVNDFNVNGSAGNLVNINASTPGTRATLVKA